MKLKILPSAAMLQAIELAKKGYGCVSPNPVVGAVIIKKGEIIGEGYHEKYGENHAEKNAILDAEKNGKSVEGSTMYVTLEPCAHTGKTPSCAKLLVEKKIKKVVIANRDPNPKAGGGIKILENAGVEVEVLEKRDLPPGTGGLRGVLHAAGGNLISFFKKNKEVYRQLSDTPPNLPCEGRDCLCNTKKISQLAREINKGFFSIHEKNRPFFTAKVAVSNNGMVAEGVGKRTQISGEEAGKFTQQFRKECDGILVGAQTVVVDNPILSVRDNFPPPLAPPARRRTQPLRICIDPNHRIPKNAKVFRDDNFFHVTGKINLHQLCEELKSRGIVRVLVEGGPKTLDYFFKENLIDELYLIQSEKNLPETGVPLFPNGTPKKMEKMEEWKCGEDTITRYIFG